MGLPESSTKGLAREKTQLTRKTPRMHKINPFAIFRAITHFSFQSFVFPKRAVLQAHPHAIGLDDMSAGFTFQVI